MTDVGDKASSDEDDEILKKLALKHRFISDGQIREVLLFQQQERAQGRSSSIGDILIDKGMISRKQLEFLQLTKMFLLMRQPDYPFAKVAIKSCLITQEQIDGVLQLQAKIFKDTRTFKPLGDLLVEEGLLTSQKRDAIQTMLERIKNKKSPGVETERKGQAKPQPPTVPQSAQQSFSQPASEASSPAATDSQEANGEDAELASTLTGRVVANETFYEIVVTEDNIKAFLKVKGEIPENVTSDTIKSLMTSKGITHGVVDDTLIDGYLRLKGAQFRPLRIAEGSLPIAGRDAEIRYIFDTRAQAIDIDQDRTIDLKNRGEVPQVKQGDLLAEKSLLIPEVPGSDVYGKKLGIAKAKDVRLMLGTGVELSQDGLKVYAKLDGRPELSRFGKLSVLPELQIEGDIGFETGNISFEGSIIVRGVVQDGFRVKGRALTAKEIAKADLDIAGDILAYGGILGATIRCAGNVRAVHIHTAKIEAQGSVIVEKGIFDSRISTSGKCVAGRGKILSSKIIAKMGVEANFIGSDISQPSTIIVGIDPVTEKQVESLKASIAAKEKEKVKHYEFIQKLEEQSKQSEIRIGELAQVQDRGALKKKTLSEKLEELKKLDDREKIAKVEGVMHELSAKIQSAEEELDKLFDQQDQIRTKISEHNDKIKEIDVEIENIYEELDVTTEWVKQHPGAAAVKVFSTAHAGTTIRGPYSSLTLTSNARSALIREAQDTEATEGGSPGRWRISIQGLF